MPLSIKILILVFMLFAGNAGVYAVCVKDMEREGIKDEDYWNRRPNIIHHLVATFFAIITFVFLILQDVLPILQMRKIGNIFRITTSAIVGLYILNSYMAVFFKNLFIKKPHIIKNKKHIRILSHAFISAVVIALSVITWIDWDKRDNASNFLDNMPPLP